MGSHCSTTEEEVTKMTLTRDELATLLIFQRITDSWVREVHRFESMRKRRKHFVIFRDANNRKLTSLAELKAEGVEVDESSFQTADCNEIVSKKARRAVRAWTNELMGGEKPAVVEEVSESGVSAAKALAKKVAAEKAAAEKAAAQAAAAEKAAAEKAAAEKLAAEVAAAELAAAEAAAAEAAAVEAAAAEAVAAEAAAAEAAAI